MTYVLAILTIAVGAATCFFGYRLFRAWLAVAGFLLGVVLGYYIGGLLFDAQVWQIVCAVGLGLLLGSVAFALYRAGVVLAGAYLGALGLAILLAVLNVPHAWWISLLGALAGALIAGFFFKFFIVCGSAFHGAYLMASGVFSLISQKDLLVTGSGSLPAWGTGYAWFVYAAILVLTIVGAAVQYSGFKKRGIQT